MWQLFVPAETPTEGTDGRESPNRQRKATLEKSSPAPENHGVAKKIWQLFKPPVASTSGAPKDGTGKKSPNRDPICSCDAESPTRPRKGDTRSAGRKSASSVHFKANILPSAKDAEAPRPVCTCDDFSSTLQPAELIKRRAAFLALTCFWLLGTVCVTLMVLALFHSRLHPSWKGSAGDNSAEVDRKEDSLGVIPPENKLDEEIRHTPSTTRHAMQGPDDADTAQLKANVLACSTNDPSKIHDFTDGLCDFIFYTTEKSYVNTRPGLPFREDDFLVHHLRIKAASSTSTAFGIDVTAEFRQQSLNDLQTPEGKHVVEGNWKSKVRSYAALDVRVSREEESNTHIVIKFLKKLKAMQAVLTKDADIGYIFLGVIIESMNGSARDALSSQQRFQRNESNEDERHHFFNKILREVEPHAVVFVTTYRKYYAGAEDSISRYGSVLPFTTPSVWNTSAVSEQPTFVDTLAFWSALDNVPGVPVMFSFSVAGRVCRPLNVQKLWTGNNVTGLCTTTSPGFITDYICENSNIHSGTLDGYNVQESLWNHAAGTLIGYDSNITMKKKMCSVFADYGFRGGWMLYDIEFMEKIPPCDIMVEKSESYYPVHFVKRILKGLHTDCAQLPI